MDNVLRATRPTRLRSWSVTISLIRRATADFRWHFPLVLRSRRYPTPVREAAVAAAHGQSVTCHAADTLAKL